MPDWVVVVMLCFPPGGFWGRVVLSAAEGSPGGLVSPAPRPPSLACLFAGLAGLEGARQAQVGVFGDEDVGSMVRTADAATTDPGVWGGLARI